MVAVSLRKFARAIVRRLLGDGGAAPEIAQRQQQLHLRVQRAAVDHHRRPAATVAPAPPPAGRTAAAPPGIRSAGAGSDGSAGEGTGALLACCSVAVSALYCPAYCEEIWTAAAEVTNEFAERTLTMHRTRAHQSRLTQNFSSAPVCGGPPVPDTIHMPDDETSFPPAAARDHRPDARPPVGGGLPRRPFARAPCCSWRCAWAGRCSSKARPASARPRSPRCCRRRSGAA